MTSEGGAFGVAAFIRDTVEGLRRRAYLLPLALSCLAAPPAEAAEQIFCRDEMSAADLHACRLGSLEQLEAEIRALYEQVLAKLHEEDAESHTNTETQLRDSQRAWLRFRDLTCAAEAEFFEDRRDWQPAEEAHCQGMMAVMRRDDLEYLLEE